jgi:hypothetical protein
MRMIKSKRVIWAERIAHMREMRRSYKFLVGKPERKRPLEILRRRWEDNIKMDLKEIEWEDMDWTYLVQSGYHYMKHVSGCESISGIQMDHGFSSRSLSLSYLSKQLNFCS